MYKVRNKISCYFLTSQKIIFSKGILKSLLKCFKVRCSSAKLQNQHIIFKIFPVSLFRSWFHVQKKILKSPFSDFCEDAHNFTTLFFVHLPLRRALCINITSLTVNCCMSYDYIIELVGYCVCTTFNSCLCARVSIIAAFILKSVSHLFNFPAEAVNLYKNPNEVIFFNDALNFSLFFCKRSNFNKLIFETCVPNF